MRPERARNGGSTGPKRLEETRCKTYQDVGFSPGKGFVFEGWVSRRRVSSLADRADSGACNLGFGFRVLCGVLGLRLRVSRSGFRGLRFGFRVSDFWFRVSGHRTGPP